MPKSLPCSVLQKRLWAQYEMEKVRLGPLLGGAIHWGLLSFGAGIFSERKRLMTSQHHIINWIPPNIFPSKKLFLVDSKYINVFGYLIVIFAMSLFLTCLVGSTDAFYCILLQELFVLLIVPPWYMICIQWNVLCLKPFYVPSKSK